MQGVAVVAFSQNCSRPEEEKNVNLLQGTGHLFSKFKFNNKFTFTIKSSCKCAILHVTQNMMGQKKQ